MPSVLDGSINCHTLTAASGSGHRNPTRRSSRLLKLPSPSSIQERGEIPEGHCQRERRGRLQRRTKKEGDRILPQRITPPTPPLRWGHNDRDAHRRGEIDCRSVCVFNPRTSRTVFQKLLHYLLLLYRTQGLRFDHSLQRKNYGNKICVVASSLAGIERKITGSSYFEKSSDTCGEVIFVSLRLRGICSM
jgi:hypothetical protein